jgi:ankyrin repeat protein
VNRLLLDAGAEVTIRAAVAMSDAARARELLSRDPSILREIHWSKGGLLSLAVKYGQLEMVRLLLDLGADPDERTLVETVEEPTPSAGTPLWYAALDGRRDIAALLLDRGADPNANVYAFGWPLRNALTRKHEAVKQLLLEHGVRTPPYMVAEAHDVDQARRLLDSDAKSWRTNWSGRQPVMAAPAL